MYPQSLSALSNSPMMRLIKTNVGCRKYLFASIERRYPNGIFHHVCRLSHHNFLGRGGGERGRILSGKEFRTQFFHNRRPIFWKIFRQFDAWNWRPNRIPGLILTLLNWGNWLLNLLQALSQNSVNCTAGSRTFPMGPQYSDSHFLRLWGSSPALLFQSHKNKASLCTRISIVDDVWLVIRLWFSGLSKQTNRDRHWLQN